MEKIYILKSGETRKYYVYKGVEFPADFKALYKEFLESFDLPKPDFNWTEYYYKRNNALEAFLKERDFVSADILELDVWDKEFQS